jgi:twitching motility protein PilI
MSEFTHAFVKLHDIAARSRQFACPLPQQAESKAIWSGIGFGLAGNQYVVPIDEVAEILNVPRFTQVPGVQGWVKGLANVRGRLMPVLDLIDFLKTTSPVAWKKRRLLALEKDEVYSGLVVDEVFGMQHFATDSFTGRLPSSFLATKDYLRGAYVKDGKVWGVFSLHALVADPRFMNVAS